VFLLAGHETTSTALTFTLWLLGQHPDEFAQVRTEVDAVAGDRELTSADVPALARTAMAVKEAMRLYPSAPIIGRRVVADDELCGVAVRGGRDVITAPWVTHRHPDFWDAPEEFRPDRFTPQAEKARHRYAWFPFGGGPRACIGGHFAMTEAVLAIATLVREFDVVTPPGEVRVVPNLTLRPTGPVRIRVSARR